MGKFFDIEKGRYFKSEDALKKRQYKHQKERTMFDTIPFGKYKGDKLLSVITTDLEYFVYIISNCELKLSKKAMDFYKLYKEKHQTELDARTDRKIGGRQTKKVAGT